MRDTTKRDGRPGEETKFILPNGIFLGASETDIIAIEREYQPATGFRRRSEDERERHSG
jgi:hypothetical protein